MKKIILHLKTIMIHKYWVSYYSFLLRNSFVGIFHDLSKFHPIEFFESIKYADGKCSPIIRCKADKGYSIAWLHHKSHNKHHLEYWLDFNGDKIMPIEMPSIYMKEMLSDWLAAGRTYVGKSFKIKDEYKWMQSRNEILCKMLHSSTNMKIRKLISILEILDDSGNLIKKINKIRKEVKKFDKKDNNI